MARFVKKTLNIAATMTDAKDMVPHTGSAAKSHAFAGQGRTLSFLAALLLLTQAPLVPQLHAQVTETNSPEKSELQAVEDKWSDAVNQRDQYGLEIVLSPLFVDIASTGDVSTRDQVIAQLVSKGLGVQKFQQKVITVRLIGQVAVVNGTYSLQRAINGQPVEEKGVFTHVFEKTRLGWACVDSQRTSLRDNSLVKPKATRKQSSAELPMHVPLLYQGAESKPQPANQGSTDTTSQPK